ncbi:MAG: helix-turn-helix transcriptional regulator [Burkholderiales bacterium]|nr:helix-turn-helix transcriptional regulator [Burkholderiales bacterium]
MRPRPSDRDACPVAISLAHVGDRWSMLILRECFMGTTRFDDFLRHLGIAPNILTRRLSALVKEGILVRHPYSRHPPRDEYLLTDAGRDFRPVLRALRRWGIKHRQIHPVADAIGELSNARPHDVDQSKEQQA